MDDDVVLDFLFEDVRSLPRIITLYFFSKKVSESSLLLSYLNGSSELLLKLIFSFECLVSQPKVVPLNPTTIRPYGTHT